MTERGNALSPWLRRYAIIVAVWTALLIVIGSFIPATTTPNPTPMAITGRDLIAGYHLAVALVVGTLILGLALWVWLADQRGWLRALAWTMVALTAAEGALGRMGGKSLGVPLSAGPAMLHAAVSSLVFAGVVAIAFFRSAGWCAGPKQVDDRGWPVLRYLALATPPLVLLQIALGAAYRYQAIGVMPHMAGALVVTLSALIASMVILQQYAQHRALKRAAIAMVSVLLVQVSLGITAFTLQLLDQESSSSFGISVAFHALVGAATLAVSMILAIETQRNVQTAPAP